MDLNNWVPQMGIRHKLEKTASPNIFVVINANDDCVSLILMFLDGILEVVIELFTWVGFQELEGTYLLLVGRGYTWRNIRVIDGEEGGTPFGWIAESNAGPASVNISSLIQNLAGVVDRT